MTGLPGRVNPMPRLWSARCKPLIGLADGFAILLDIYHRLHDLMTLLLDFFDMLSIHS